MTRPSTTEAGFPSTKNGRGDPQQYRAVVDKRFNKRFSANPAYVRLADSTEQARVERDDVSW